MTQKIAIIGTGLIGGSFALALRESGQDIQFSGYGRNEANLRRAVERGIVDSYSTRLPEAVAGCDVVLLASPVGAMADLLMRLGDCIGADTIVTDAGSVKQAVIDGARAGLKNAANFVPAHPIAGTEHSGVEAAFATLYHDRRVIFTPVAETAAEPLEQVKALWRLTGASIETMTPEHHDEVFAATSHLPHALAFCLVETLYRMDQQNELLRYAAGGFSDFTRIASSDPVMWRDVCLHNRPAILKALGRLQEGLDTLVTAIDEKDGDRLYDYFEIAKQTRDTRILGASARANRKN
jgi:prephenate dehydrogenase